MGKYLPQDSPPPRHPSWYCPGCSTAGDTEDHLLNNCPERPGLCSFRDQFDAICTLPHLPSLQRNDGEKTFDEEAMKQEDSDWSLGRINFTLDDFVSSLEESVPEDPVNPGHYRQGDVECIDAIEAAVVNLKGIEAVCTGKAIKYLWRWKEKGGHTDLRKAVWYINRLTGD